MMDRAPMGGLTLRTMSNGSEPLVTYHLEDSDSFMFTGNVAISPAGDRVVVERRSMTPPRGVTVFLNVFRLEGRSARRHLVGATGRAHALVFHPRRPLAVTAAKGPVRELTFWDLEQCLPVRMWTDQSAGLDTPLAISPDGNLLVTTPTERPREPESLVIRDFETGAVRHRIVSITKPRDLLFSPSGKLLAVTSLLRKPHGYLISLDSGQQILTPLPDWDLGTAMHLRFVGDTDQIMTLDFNGELGLSDAGSGASRRVLDLKHLSHFYLSADSRRLLGFNRQRGRFQLYEFPELREVISANPENKEVKTPRCAAQPFSAENRYVVTIDATHTPQLRNGRTLELLIELPRHQKPITGMVFSASDLLAVLESESTSGVTLYDLPAIRRELADLGLDWAE
jgi:hypothetical protein